MASESNLSSSESLALKAISGVGLTIFTVLMLVHWNNVLSKVEVAEETAPAVTPSTTTNAAAAPPVPSTSGVAPAATSTSAVATDSTTATPSTPVSSGTAPITTTPSTPTTTAPITTTTATTPAPATTTTSTPVETAPAAPSNLAATPSTPAAPARTSNFDPAKLDALEVQLYDTIDKGWTEYPSFGQDLVYKVTVDADGNIVNYQPLHDAAVDYLNETPLDQITPNSAAAGADFVVVMTPTGILEVDAWIGQ